MSTKPTGTPNERPDYSTLGRIAFARELLAGDVGDWSRDRDVLCEKVVDLRSVVRVLLLVVDGLDLTPDQIRAACIEGAYRAHAASPSAPDAIEVDR